jgi:galactokinase
LEKHKDELTDEEYRRMRHPITEKIRVFAFVEALKAKDFEKAGELLNQTHKSLDEDYEVMCEELNIMQKAAIDSPGCFGARMVGGGFGGCVMALVAQDKKQEFVKSVKQKYDSAPAIRKQKIDSEIWEAISGDGLKIERLTDEK